MLLREIPAHLLRGVAEGQLQVYGSIVKDTGSGQIVGHLQQTGPLLSQLADALPGMNPLGFLGTGLNTVLDVRILDRLETLQTGMTQLLGMQSIDLAGSWISVIQNEQIKQRLGNLQIAVENVQALQLATLLGSGLGFGISVAHQYYMQKRLRLIETRLEDLHRKVDRITKDRRSDELRMILRQLSGLQNLFVAHAENGLAGISFDLRIRFTDILEQFEEHISRILDPAVPDELAWSDLAGIWPLLNALALCHSARIHVLFEADELPTAKNLAEGAVRKMTEELRRFDPAAIQHRLGLGEPRVDGVPPRTAALVLLLQLRDAYAAMIRAVACQGFLACHLQRSGHSGRAYMAEIRGVDRPAVMLLEQG